MDPISHRKRVLYFPQWIDFDVEQGIVEYARRARWALTSVTDHGGDLRQALRSGSVRDGIITLIKQSDSDIARYVETSGLPTVDLADTVLELDLARVLLDDGGIGRMGADHLMNQGFDHLAFFRALNSGQTAARAAAFDEQVLRRGRTLHRLDLVAAGVSVMDPEGDAARVPWLAAELARLPKPLGLMVQYDTLYWLVVEVCAFAGLRIPDDVAVVAVGNKESVCELSEPTLTSVEHNQRLQGFLAAEVLDQLMNGGVRPHRPIRVPPLHVVVRESTDVFAVHDHTVRSALLFLRDHFRDATIGVEDVVKACGTSRRRLYSAFEAHWGRPIAETLAEFRIAEARRLLATTTDKQYAVAMQSGFASQTHMSRAFSRRLGMSPGAFRASASPTTKRLEDLG
ncbi:MAG: substrate-binding domain-containing protein [Proteobacteria bacterium]|jgi:LacI family transcriptional regulator|nr:substrate-binding domain-containing protein [Pseudomonadota bacterium]